MNKSTKSFNFSIYTDVVLTVDEIWPDGNAPENPTVADVVAVIDNCGGTRSVLRDWDLDNDLTLTISDGKDSQDAP